MPNKYDKCPQCGTFKDMRADMCRSCRNVQPLDHKARLMRKVAKGPDGCWNFTGYLLSNGYGRIKGFDYKPILAHRFSYELHFGKIPKGLCVCHKCDNRQCVNSAHLLLGTQAENMRDMSNKGRAVGPTEVVMTRNMRHWKAKLTTEQIREIRSRSSEPRKQLATEFGTSARYISSIICGRKRKYA